jgi:hypothetical protein
VASKSELEAIIKLAGSIDPSLRKALLDANKKMGDLGNKSSMTGKLIRSAFNVAAKGAAIGAAAIGVGLMLVAKQGLALASDLNEVQNVVDVTFGTGSKQIDSWAQGALKSYGLGELAAKKYSGVLGALMKSSGVSSDHLVSMSENLTALSGDFASFYNLKTDEAFEKIRAGISGETEPLKALGINMSVANLEAFALSKGIKTAYEKMSQGDKTMLRYNYLLEQSADAQGDFARTQDGYANQQRLFSESFKQLSAKIMTGALPAFTSLYKKANELIDTFMGSPEKIQKLQDAIARAADKAIELIPIAIGYVGDFIGFLGDLYNGAERVYQFINKNWAVIEPLILGIVSSMVAWKAITLGMAIYSGIMAGIKAGTISATIAQWGLNAAVLANPITWIVLAIAAAFGILVAGIYLLIKYWDDVVIAMKNAWTWFQNLIDKIPDFALVLTGPLAPLLLLIKHFEKVKEIATGAIGAVKKFFGFGGDDKEGSVDLSSVPKYARGGFANQPSIFGEAGPEAAIPLKRTPRSLSLLSKTADALGVGGGSGSGGTTFVYSPTYGSGTSESQVKKDYEDFIAMCESWMESRRRESFA